MAIFAEVTENERIIDRHLRGIHPLLDYDASESQSMISIWFDWNRPISTIWHYGHPKLTHAAARFLCDSRATCFINRPRGFDSVRGRILPFSYLQAVAINTVLALPRSLWFSVESTVFGPNFDIFGRKLGLDINFNYLNPQRFLPCVISRLLMYRASRSAQRSDL